MCVVQYMRGTNVQNASYRCCEHQGFPGESSVCNVLVPWTNPSPVRTGRLETFGHSVSARSRRDRIFGRGGHPRPGACGATRFSISRGGGTAL
eukprot:1194375-Prorocentrum_minimum.AAC.10